MIANIMIRSAATSNSANILSFWRRNGERIQQLFHCGTVVFRISKQPKFVVRV
ncbi:hypothetical protein BDA96_07G155600 [Sorghum bicolor]|uniref:Uncharacterized protein n=1 Tax=Sorghum bicolor TaxID=4558 RepID=A0A921QKV3_SORBI|nr:hypothetical protein BDA96_07G155600 [Sorghum bicolor]